MPHRRSSISLRGFAIGVLAALACLGIPQAKAQDSDEPPIPREILHGRVVDPENKPVVGATVIAASRPDPSDGGRGMHVVKQQPVAETVTDREGSFRIEVEGTAPFVLLASASGWAPTTLTRAKPGDVGTIRLSQGSVAHGRVLDKLSGKPVSGARVRIRSTRHSGLMDEAHRNLLVGETTTDESGSFRFQRLDHGRHRVDAVAHRYAEEWILDLQITPDETNPDPVLFYLVPGFRLSGIVVDADDSPIEDAQILLRPDPEHPLGQGGHPTYRRTGEDGSFELRGIPLEPAYLIEATHPDHGPAWLKIAAPDGAGVDDVRVVMPPGSEIQATLLDDGEPFEGDVEAKLTYRVPESDSVAVLQVPQERIRLENGVLTVSRIADGTVALELDIAGFSKTRRNGLTVTGGEPLDLGEISLTHGSSLRGKVLDGKDKPVARATVEVSAFDMEEGYTQKQTQTAADGTFAIRGLPEDDYAIEVSARGFAIEEIEDVATDGEPVEIRLQRSGKIRGRVVTGDPPTPVGKFTVELLEADDTPFPPSHDPPLRYRDPKGIFRVLDLPPGAHSFEVKAAGLVAATVEGIEVTPGSVTDIGDVVLEPGETLYGLVVSADTQEPVVGADVRVASPSVLSMPALARDRPAPDARTGPEGRFSISGLLPGLVRLQIEHNRYAPATRSVEIAPETPPADLRVELGTGGVIVGTFRNDDGEPVAGATVQVTRPPFEMIGDAVVTDRLGRFRIERIPPGTYQVMGMPRPVFGSSSFSTMGDMKRASANVSSGETTRVDLPDASLRIRVHGVVRRGQDPVQAMTVWIPKRNDAGPSDVVQARSDAAGAFEVGLAQAGTYNVMITGVEGQAPKGAMVEVEIAEGEHVAQDIVIPVGALTGMVLDVDTGEALEDVQVVALKVNAEGEPESLAGQTTTDAEGRYHLTGFGEGSYQVSFTRSGFAIETIGPMEFDDPEGQTRLDASLLRASKCRIRVVGEHGEPIEGAFVVPMSSGIAAAGLTVQTDRKGFAELDGLADGAHDLGVVQRGLSPALASGVLVGVEDPQDRTVILRRGSALSIAVLDADEQPVERAQVSIKDDRGTDITGMLATLALLEGQMWATGRDGTLHVAHIEPGRYEVQVRHDERLATAKVRVEATGANTLQLELRN